MKTFIQVVVALFFFIALTPDIFSQTSYNKLVPNLTAFSHNSDISLKPDKQSSEKLSSLVFSFDYSSNTNTFGNFNQFVRQPSYSPSVTLFSGFNFDIGIFGNIISNSNDSLDAATYETDILAGYNINLLKDKLVIYPGYSHSFYSKNSGFLKSAYTDNFQLSIYYQDKYLSAGVSNSYLTGKDNMFTSLLYTGILLEKENFIFKNSIAGFYPEIDLNFGDYEYLNSYYFNQYPVLLLDYMQTRDIRALYFLRNRFPNISDEEIISYFADKYSEDNFKLTSVGLVFPFEYMIGNFSVNLSLMVIFPVNMPEYLDNSTEVYFSTGLSYMIGF